MNARMAGVIRRGILDARARVFPYWSPMGAMRAANWGNDQPRHPAYREAYERTHRKLPAPRPPRGGSGISK